MAEPARRHGPSTETAEDPPPLDPTAIDRAYRRHRAKRQARIEHRRRARWASVRFWIVLWVLLVVCVVAALTIWAQVQQLFGL